MKTRTVIIICVTVLSMVLVVAALYLTIAGKNLAESLPAIAGFATPTITSLIALLMNQSAISSNQNMMVDEIKPKIEIMEPVISKIEPVIEHLTERLEQHDNEHDN